MGLVTPRFGGIGLSGNPKNGGQRDIIDQLAAQPTLSLASARYDPKRLFSSLSFDVQIVHDSNL